MLLLLVVYTVCAITVNNIINIVYMISCMCVYIYIYIYTCMYVSADSSRPLRKTRKLAKCYGSLSRRCNKQRLKDKRA